MSKHHVVPHAKGWAVKAEGKARASAVFAKQEEAIAAAKKIAANQGGVVLIHRPDGTIRAERVERITGTIKVDVESSDSLTVVQNKIKRADKRLKALSAAVATKRKARERKAVKSAAKSGPAKKAAAKKPAAKKAAAKKPAAKKPAARKPVARKPKSLFAEASEAIRKLVAKNAKK